MFQVLQKTKKKPYIRYGIIIDTIRLYCNNEK